MTHALAGPALGSTLKMPRLAKAVKGPHHRGNSYEQQVASIANAALR